MTLGHLAVRPDFEKRGGAIAMIEQDILTRNVLSVRMITERDYLTMLRFAVNPFGEGLVSKIWIDCDADAIVCIVSGVTSSSFFRFRQNNQDLFEQANSLLPVVTQDYSSKEILMLSYANWDAYHETLRTGSAVYWSTSRKKIWRKGEESGNVLKLKDIQVGVDNATLLYGVDARNVPACHTNARSCFYREAIHGTVFMPVPKMEGGSPLYSIEAEVHPDLVKENYTDSSTRDLP